MQSSERQVAFVKNVAVQRSLFSMVTYNLILTDKRMVLLHSKYSQWGLYAGGAVGGALGGAIGSVAQSVLESGKKQDEMSSKVLNELLAKDTKSFDVAYEDIAKVRFYQVERKRRLGANIRFNMMRYRLAIASKKTPKPFRLTSEQSEQLSTVLPTIPALKGKIV